MSVAKLSEQLAAADHEIAVFTTTANGEKELAVDTNSKVFVDGVAVRYFKRITKDHTHFSPALLMRVWKHARYFDVVHIHAWWNLVSVLSAFIAVVRRVPLVVSPRGTLSDYSFDNGSTFVKMALHKSIGKWLLTNSYIHATSGPEAQHTANLLKPKKIFTLPNFVKLDEDQPGGPPITASVFRILYLSRLDEKKGLDILLNALPLLTVPYHLTIAGDGEKDYVAHLKKLTIDNATDEHITWAGFAGENKFDILREHQLLVLPSHNENFANVVIESLSVGTAVLISESVGLADYVASNQLGWLCQTNFQSVADRLNDISANQKVQLDAIRISGPLIIRRDFDEEVLIKRYLNMYEDIIKHSQQ